MRKRKMLLGALLLGIAIIAGSNGITVEAATGKYTPGLPDPASMHNPAWEFCWYYSIFFLKYDE